MKLPIPNPASKATIFFMAVSCVSANDILINSGSKKTMTDAKASLKPFKSLVSSGLVSGEFNISHNAQLASELVPELLLVDEQLI